MATSAAKAGAWLRTLDFSPAVRRRLSGALTELRRGLARVAAERQQAEREHALLVRMERLHRKLMRVRRAGTVQEWSRGLRLGDTIETLRLMAKDMNRPGPGKLKDFNERGEYHPAHRPVLNAAAPFLRLREALISAGVGENEATEGAVRGALAVGLRPSDAAALRLFVQSGDATDNWVFRAGRGGRPRKDRTPLVKLRDALLALDYGDRTWCQKADALLSGAGQRVLAPKEKVRLRDGLRRRRWTATDVAKRIVSSRDRRAPLK